MANARVFLMHVTIFWRQRIASWNVSTSKCQNNSRRGENENNKINQPLSRQRWHRRRFWLEDPWLLVSKEARRRSARAEAEDDAEAAAILPQQLVLWRSSMVRLRWIKRWRLELDVEDVTLFLRLAQVESSDCRNWSVASGCWFSSPLRRGAAVDETTAVDEFSSDLEVKTSVLFA